MSRLNKFFGRKRIIFIIIMMISFNGCGGGGGSSSGGNHATPLQTPTALQALAVNSSQISLSWVDNSTTENGFSIERRPSGGIYSVVTTVATNLTTYIDSGLLAGTLYQYRIRAFNGSDNSDYSNEASATTSSSIPTTYPAKPLPEKFVGVFLGVDPIAGSDQVDYVKRTAAIAKQYNLDAINLVINWRSLQPTADSLDFQSMHDMILAIKEAGLQCILRIYANSGNKCQSWPSWLSLSDKYYSGYSSFDGKDVYNPLPWDINYRDKYSLLIRQLNDRFGTSHRAYADAIQIILGGNFGEQILWDYQSPLPRDQYLDKLYTAQEQHITEQLSGWSTTSDYIVMVNSLAPDIPNQNARIGNYAISKGVKYVQTNAGSCNLKNPSYGPENIALLKSYSGDKKFIIEDSYSDCKQPIQNRLDILKQLENDNGIIFSGFIMSIEDLNNNNNASGIVNLKAHFSQP